MPPATVSIPPRPGRFGLSPRGDVSPLRPGSTRQPTKARANPTGIEHLALDCDRRLVEHAVPVRRSTRDLRRIALVERVGRPEQQHPLPRIRERDAHGVVRNRHRCRPGPASSSSKCTPFDRRPSGIAAGSSSARTLSIHGPVAFTTARASTETGLARHTIAHLGAPHATPHLPERDHLRVVRDDAPAAAVRPHVREREPPVVCVRVDVDAAAAQAVDPEVRDPLARTRRRQQPAEPSHGERRVEREPEPDVDGRYGTVPVEREQERQPPTRCGATVFSSARRSRCASRTSLTSPSRR